MRLHCRYLLIVTFGLSAFGQNAVPVANPQENNDTSPVEVKTTFHVRYVSGTNVYVDGGRSAGLAEGMRLVMNGQPAAPAPGEGAAPKPAALPSASPKSADNTQNEADSADATQNEPAPLPTVAELKVVAVAETSAVCELVSSTHPLAVGDVVTLSREEVEKLVEKRTLGSTRNYLAVVSFTEGDPMDEDVRDEIPRPPLPSINRAQGRVGFDFSAINSGSFGSSYTSGVVLRADVTRIYGTYWNLQGFWRGNLTQQNSRGVTTLQDLINRTYTLNLSYNNPDSKWVAGMGRLFLPWATSLDTLDGGYIGRRLSHITTAGIFAGSTPDPSSWSYDPNRRIGGGFVNFTGGSYDNFRYSSTFGGGVSMLKWQIDRPFVFTENSFDYKHKMSIYEALQMDQPSVGLGVTKVPFGMGRSFFTFRVQPVQWISFDLNHTYFRDIPTYNASLIGTGLLDKYLFQGFNGGVRVQVPYHITLYTTVGRSHVSGDASASWNYLYGITFDRIWKTGLRADARYSVFNSPFAQGKYSMVGLSRSFRDGMRFEAQIGSQKYTSGWTQDTGSRFLNAFGEFNLGRKYFFNVGFTANRGGNQDYNQLYTVFGYRFDNRQHREVRNNAGLNNAGPNNAGSGNAGPNNTGPNNAVPGTAGPNNTGPNNAVPGTAGPNNTGPNNSGPNNASPNEVGSNDVSPE